MNKRTENQINGMLRTIKRRRWHVVLLVCLALAVTAGVAGVFHLPAIAKTYQVTELSCTAVPPEGAACADFFVHIHNDVDCFDANGNLVCPLPEIKPHRHTSECYTTTRTLVCTTPESDGHRHTADCYTRVRGDLTCEESTDPVLDEEGNVLEEGHVHTDECFAWTEELSCGMEEGQGAHHHDDSCYETRTTLICTEPEILLHTHTDACYQKNEDGSIYVDEDGNSFLICGQLQVLEHVHGPECFTTYELDDGEPELIFPEEEEQPAENNNQETQTGDNVLTDNSDTDPVDENTPDAEKAGDSEKAENTDLNTAEETAKETAEETVGVSMPAQDFHGATDEVEVFVTAPEGAFPAGTTMHVSTVPQEDVIGALNDAANGAMVRNVQAVDITFRNAEGEEIEPLLPISVRMSRVAKEQPIVPEAAPETKESVVLHVENDGSAQIVENANVTDTEAEFESDSFSTYIMADLITEDYLASDGTNYRISVKYDANAKIPEGAELAVAEITGGVSAYGQGYEDYLADTENALGENERVTFARFFDISIIKDGIEIQPEAPVEVKIELVDNLTKNVKAVHFDESVDVLDTSLSQDGTVVFSADSFSVYGVILTEVIRTDFLTSYGALYDVAVHYNSDAEIPEGSTLHVTEIEQGTEAYENSYRLLFNSEPEEDAPMLAVDISILSPDGIEIEPRSAVTVDLTLKQLPEGVSPEELQGTIKIDHLKEVPGGIAIETVADGDQVQVGDGISASFAVNSFSTYTIYWNYWNYLYSINTQLVDTSGNSIGTATDNYPGISSATAVSYLAPNISGYSFSKATIGGVNGTAIQRIRRNNGNWQYNTSASGGTWNNIGNNTVNFVYEPTNPYVKVYVYVAAYDEDGNQFKNNPEFLELLGISGDTVDGNGYFPVGEIYIDKSFFNGKTTDKWAALIKSSADWEQVLAALGELDTSTLVYDYYNTPTDYSLNRGNSVGDYMDQAIGDINKGAGSQCTALFGWSGHSYGFEDQTVEYHLDLRFQTNKVTFITGNNGISSGASKDGTTVDVRAYIQGSPIQQPRNLVIPAGYRLVGYYNDPDFTTPWNKIGTPITQDEVAYIKITPQDNVILHYRPVPAGGGTVSLDAEGVNPVTGTPAGSTATANRGYKFVGWYADEECTQLLSTETTYVPTKNSNARWVDGTTYYAKFEEETVTLTFVAEDHVHHVELVTDAGEVVSVTGNNTKEMKVTINQILGPSVTVRGVAEDGYVIKEWTINGRDGALTTNDNIVTAINDDPTATDHWTERTYHVWAEKAKTVTVEKEVKLLGAIQNSDINTTVYFVLWDHQINDNVRDEHGNVLIKSIDIVNGVPQGTVSFNDLQSGTYSVWEVNENGQDMLAGTVVIGNDIVVSKIETRHGNESGNRATVNDQKLEDNVAVINTYNHKSDVISWTVGKLWYTTKNKVQEDMANIDIPEGATSTLVLYRRDDLETPLQTVILDGTVDATGENDPWVATFDELQVKDIEGHTIEYVVKETAFTPEKNEQGYFYPYEGETDHDGGVIRNAVISGNINVYKQIEVQPRNEDMNALVSSAVGNLEIHVTGPHEYDQTFTFTNVTDPYNPSLQITNLPAGKYTVEELGFEDLLTGRKWNPTLSWIKAGNGEEQSGRTSVTFEVATDGASNDSVDVRLKNDYTKYDIVATKVWEDQGIENADHPAVNLTLYRIDSAGTRTIVGTKIIGANQTGDGLTVKWEQQEQQDQQYTYEIEEAPVNGYTCTGITGDMFTGFTITNTRAAKIKILKTDQTGSPLEGAIFSLKGGEIDEKDLISRNRVISVDGKEETEALIYENQAMPIGTYILSETAAPAGYNALGDVQITVENTGTDIKVTATINGTEIAGNQITRNLSTGEYTIKIMNSAGVELPSTGGPGTGLFTAIGGMMTAMAGAVLALKKRKEHT